MEHLTHHPREGERIDTIAHHYYGDAAQVGHILRANPILLGRLTALAGQPLKIPLIDPPPPEAQIGLPPWRAND